MFQINGKIDNNDLSFVTELHGVPEFATPAPFKESHGIFTEINPHVTRFLINGKKVSVFNIKPIYYHHHDGTWRPMEEVAHSFGNCHIDLKEDWGSKMDPGYLQWLMRRMEVVKGRIGITIPTNELVTVESRQILKEGENIFFTTSTFYPDKDPETTSVDGRVGVFDAGGLSWAAIRSHAGNNFSDNATSQAHTRLRGDGNTNLYDSWLRGVWLFDTSSISDGDTINSGEFGLMISLTPNDLLGGSGSASLCSSNPASNTGLASGDYDSLGVIKFSADVTLASMSVDNYSIWTLNASGLAAVDPTSVTKLGTRITRDLEDSEATWGAGEISDMGSYMAEETGTDKSPKLVIVHTTEGTVVSPVTQHLGVTIIDPIIIEDVSVFPTIIPLAMSLRAPSVVASNDWVYEQLFNLLNTGTLNSQDSWTATNVNIVETVESYEGAKCLRAANSDGFADRNITAVTSGEFYVSIRKSNVDVGDVDNKIYIIFEEGIVDLINIRFQGDIIDIIDGGVSTPILTGAVADQWYRIGIRFECGSGNFDGLASNEFRSKVDDGLWSDPYAFRNAGTEINHINLANFKAELGETAYFDAIGPTFIAGSDDVLIEPSTENLGLTLYSPTVTTEFEDPYDLQVTVATDYSATVTWTKGDNFNSTLVRYKEGSAPTSVSDGELLYTGEGEEATVRYLDPAKVYYFRAWGANSTFNLGTETNTTLAMTPLGMDGDRTFIYIGGLVSGIRKYAKTDLSTVLEYINPESGVYDAEGVSVSGDYMAFVDTDYPTFVTSNGYLYDMRTSTELIHLDLPGDHMRAVHIDAEEEWVYYGTLDGYIIFYDIATLTQHSIQVVAPENEFKIRSIHTYGDDLIITANDWKVYYYDRTDRTNWSLKTSWTLTSNVETSYIDDELLAYGSDEQEVVIRDKFSPYNVIDTLTDPTNDITSISVSNDKKYWLITSDDKKAYFYTRTGNSWALTHTFTGDGLAYIEDGWIDGDNGRLYYVLGEGNDSQKIYTSSYLDYTYGTNFVDANVTTKAFSVNDPISIEVTQQDPFIDIPTVITPSTINMDLAFLNPTIEIGGDIVIIPDVINIVATLYPPAITVAGDVVVSPETLHILMTLYSPTVVAINIESGYKQVYTITQNPRTFTINMRG